MFELNQRLQDAEMYLQRLQREGEERIKNIPEGRLRVADKKGYFQYFWQTGAVGEPIGGRYLRREQLELAQKLAQRDYDVKALKIIKKGLKEIRKLGALDTITELTHIYDKTSAGRKMLITPFLMSDKEYVQWWLENSQKTGTLQAPVTAIYTENGECVRSKSEKIIADKLFLEHIPYVYECSLYMQGYGKIYPDFKVLNTRTRETYVWEHLGMMDDSEYVDKALRKIEVYEQNGYLPGRNLILTHETRERPLNSKIVKKMISTFLQ